MKFQWPNGIKSWREALNRYKYVLLVMALGTVLLLIPTGDTAADSAGTQLVNVESFDLEGFEKKLSKTLSDIQGAGDVTVVLTLKSGSRQVLAQDVEQGEKNSSASTVTVGKGSGNQEVVALQTIAPQFRGALVVCTGGGNPKVKLDIVAAVSALTGLGASSISVCQGQA